MVAILIVAGCQQQPKQTMAASSVLDVRPVARATPRYAPPVQVAQPPSEPTLVTVVDPAPAAMPPAGAPVRTAARKTTGSAKAQQAGYTVKKGDTLFHIAKTEYGDGKKWTVIASANPGLTPQSLKAGQTLVIP
jgi:nucleoid-associated protein YgaU